MTIRLGIKLALGAAALGGAGVAAAYARHTWIQNHIEDEQQRTAEHMLTSRPRSKDHIRVMTYNVKAGHGRHELGKVPANEREDTIREIARQIERYDPDVVLLQEVERNYPRNGSLDEYTLLTHALHATSSAFSGGRLGAAIIARNGYGLGKAERTRLEEEGPAPDEQSQAQERPSRLDRFFKKDDEHAPAGPGSVRRGGIGRSAVVAAPLLDSAGRPIVTIATPHMARDTFDEFKSRYAEPITAGKAKGYPRALIVGGDFNAGAPTVAKTFTQGGRLEDAFEKFGVPASDERTRTTFPHSFKRSFKDPIDDKDHILVDRDHEVAAISVAPLYFQTGTYGGEELSDHRPVLADVLLKHSRATGR